VVLHDRFGVTQPMSASVGKIGRKCVSDVDYLKKGLAKLGFEDSSHPTEATLQNYLDR
jgi:hypothetical protein